MIINFENTASHKCLVKKSESLWMARSEITEHSFFVLIQKWHMLNSVLKIPVANVYRLITPQTHPGHGWCVASWSFQLSMVCGSKFSWIKVKSASETVYETFNVSLKLLGVLSKQLAQPVEYGWPRV